MNKSKALKINCNPLKICQRNFSFSSQINTEISIHLSQDFFFGDLAIFFDHWIFIEIPARNLPEKNANAREKGVNLITSRSQGLKVTRVVFVGFLPSYSYQHGLSLTTRRTVFPYGQIRFLCAGGRSAPTQGSAKIVIFVCGRQKSGKNEKKRKPRIRRVGSNHKN